MAMTMHMTDAEIYESWNHCADKKEQVKILADLNVCSIWDMMLKLNELEAPGLNKRWYQNLNPNRKTKSEIEEQKMLREIKETRAQPIQTRLSIRDILMDLIREYWNSRCDSDKYNLGYAEATITAMEMVINIDPPGLE